LQPDEWNTVLASTLSDVGRVKDGEGRVVFSPTKYSEWFESLPSTSKDVLFGKPGTELRDQLAKLTSVAADVGSIEKLARPLRGISDLQTTAAGTAILGSALTFNIPFLFSTLSVLGTQALIGSALTSPKILRWLNRIGDVKDQGAAIRVADALAKAAKRDVELLQLSQIAQQAVTGQVQAPPMGGEDVADDFGEMSAEPLTDEEVPDMGLAEPLEPTEPVIEEPMVGEDGSDDVVGSAEPMYESLYPTAAQEIIGSLGEDEALALTALGEASPNPAEQRAVIHTVLNRQKVGGFGNSLPEILRPDQFNAWENAAELAAKRDTPQFKRALELVRQVRAGELPDNTGGATHFYAPRAQAEGNAKNPKRYRSAVPSWAQGKEGRQIGATRFFSGV
jgi:hypothetical protein